MKFIGNNPITGLREGNKALLLSFAGSLRRVNHKNINRTSLEAELNDLTPDTNVTIRLSACFYVSNPFLLSLSSSILSSSPLFLFSLLFSLLLYSHSSPIYSPTHPYTLSSPLWSLLTHLLSPPHLSTLPSSPLASLLSPPLPSTLSSLPGTHPFTLISSPLYSHLLIPLFSSPHLSTLPSLPPPHSFLSPLYSHLLIALSCSLFPQFPHPFPSFQHFFEVAFPNRG